MKIIKSLALLLGLTLIFNVSLVAYAESDVFAIKPAGDGTSLNYSATPGSKIIDEVVVRNLSDKERTFEVFATDKEELEVAPGEEPPAFSLKRRDETQITVGAWTKIEQSKVTVAANSEQKVKFTIELPATLDKTAYAGGVLTTPVVEVAPGEERAGVTVNTRLGVRILLSIIQGPATVQDFTTGRPETAPLQAAAKAGLFTPFNITLAVVLLVLILLLFFNKGKKSA